VNSSEKIIAKQIERAKNQDMNPTGSQGLRGREYRVVPLSLNSKTGKLRKTSVALAIALISHLFIQILHPEASDNAYRNAQYGFSISFPEGWALFEEDGLKAVVGAKNKSGDRITVTIDPLSAGYKGKYKDITKIPGYSEYNRNVISRVLHGYILDGGVSRLNNNTALWIKFVLVRKSGDKKTYAVVYQIQALKEDRIYTIAAKLSGKGRTAAIKRFYKLWPALEKAIFSFRLP